MDARRLNNQAILVDQAAEPWEEAVPPIPASPPAVRLSLAACIDGGSGQVDGTCFFGCPLMNSRLVRRHPCLSSQYLHHALDRYFGTGGVEVVDVMMGRDVMDDAVKMDCIVVDLGAMIWEIDAVVVVAGPIDGMSARSQCTAKFVVRQEDRKRDWMDVGEWIRFA